MYKRESLEALRDIIDPKDILSSIGGVPYSVIKENSVELRCPCPIHGGDNRDGFGWKKSSGVWTCFTRDCGHNITRDLYGFVSCKLGKSFTDAAKYLAETYHFQLEKGDISDYTSWKGYTQVCKDHKALMSSLIPKLEILEELPSLDNSKESWDKSIEYLQSRGYKDLSEVKEFNMYPCIDPTGNLRLGIPTYDEEGGLVGVNARRMDGVVDYGEKQPKYMLLSGYKKANILYNLHIAKHFCKNREIILVEGELSCIRLHTYGIKNSVATSGSILSEVQAVLACKYSPHILFLMEEGDAAEKGVRKSIETLLKLAGMSIKISIAPLRQGDADDNSRQAVIQALENAKKVSRSAMENIIDS